MITDRKVSVDLPKADIKKGVRAGGSPSKLREKVGVGGSAKHP